MLGRLAGAAAVALGIVVLALGGAPTAFAGPVEDAVAGLRVSAVFVDPAAGRKLDAEALRAQIGSEPIKIAVLPAGPGVSEVRTWPREIARQLPGNTIAALSGRYFYAGSEVLCRGLAGQAAANAIAKHNTELDQGSNSDLTAALTDFVTEVKAGQRCDTAGGAGRGDRYADEPGGGEASIADDTSTVLPWVLGGLGLAVLGVGAWVLVARQRASGRVQHHRDQARDLVARLGTELAQLPYDGNGNAPVAQARADAAGKHGEAEAILIGATTDVQYAAARHAAIEGLTAARAARIALGGDPGAPIPPFDPPADAGAGWKAAPPYPPRPHYAPGAPYYHAGGAAPDGWYPEPFWERSAAAADSSGEPSGSAPRRPS
jgi:hypothetical protein